MSRQPAASHDPVTQALQSYADRGVFRGFRATPAPRGRTGYQFLWLTRKPTTAVFDAHRRVLAFPSLFPDVDKDTAGALTTIAAARTSRAVPDHKRVDARRARVTSALRKGDLSLSVEIRGSNHDYAVKKVLNLINEMFLTLHEVHPEYLVEHFGISTE